MLFSDGYTVSDVVMYWKDTPVRGVEVAELPQFTIIGFETNDRYLIQLQRNFKSVNISLYCNFFYIIVSKVPNCF